MKPLAELSLVLPRARKEIRTQALAFLGSQGIDPARIAVFDNGRALRLAVYLRSGKKALRMREAFRGFPHRFIRLKERVLTTADWFDKWKTRYRVMPLGRRFTLVPSRKIRGFRRQGKRIPIYLDPGGAFGSGLHETTRLMILLMERVAGRFETFCDVGSGTGILSIVAYRLGAGRADLIERDPASVRAARANLRLNGCPWRGLRQTDLFKICRKRRYDLVGANLLSLTLLKAKDKIIRSVRPGGYLIVSGIHLENLDDFRPGFRASRLRCLRLMKLRGWAGLLYKKG